MAFPKRYTFGLIVLALLVAAVPLLIYYQNTRAQAWSLTSPPGLGDVATRMAELGGKEQFEDEIQLGLGSRTGRPSDYFIYQMVAQAYAIREYCACSRLYSRALIDRRSRGSNAFVRPMHFL